MLACTTARCSEGVASPDLDTNIANPLGYVCVKVPARANEPLSPGALVAHSDDGTAPAATTRPRWPSSTGARRGYHPVADTNQIDYVGKHDGRDTILLSIFSSGDQPLCMGSSALLELRGGQMGL